MRDLYSNDPETAAILAYEEGPWVEEERPSPADLALDQEPERDQVGYDQDDGDGEYDHEHQEEEARGVHASARQTSPLRGLRG